MPYWEKLRPRLPRPEPRLQRGPLASLAVSVSTRGTKSTEWQLVPVFLWLHSLRPRKGAEKKKKKQPKSERGETGRRKGWLWERVESVSLWADSSPPLRPPIPSTPAVGICSRDQPVTWESLRVTARTISVCDNHTERRGFIRGAAGCQSTSSSTSAWLCDDPCRFFHPGSQDRCRAGQQGIWLLLRPVVMIRIFSLLFIYVYFFPCGWWFQHFLPALGVYVLSNQSK